MVSLSSRCLVTCLFVLWCFVKRIAEISLDATSFIRRGGDVRVIMEFRTAAGWAHSLSLIKTTVAGFVPARTSRTAGDDHQGKEVLQNPALLTVLCLCNR